MKKLLPSLLAGTAAALALALTPAHAQNKPQEKVTLMLNWYLYSEHAPFFLGKERGYFAEEGIDLDIQEGRGSAVTAQAVAAKSATFGYIDVTTMIKAAAKGAPLKSTGVLFQVSPMSVMGFTEKNIKTPKDIIGKTVAVTPGDSMSQMWPLFLKANNIQADQVKIVRGRPDQAQCGDDRAGRSAAWLRDGPGDQAAGRHRQVRHADPLPIRRRTRSAPGSSPTRTC
jgi:NitT/TauT family transport system substrate-binding protein